MTLSLLCITFSITAQKKVMEHEDKAEWNRIRNVNISNSGDYVLYGLEKGEKDQENAQAEASDMGRCGKRCGSEEQGSSKGVAHPFSSADDQFIAQQRNDGFALCLLSRLVRSGGNVGQ